MRPDRAASRTSARNIVSPDSSRATICLSSKSAASKIASENCCADRSSSLGKASWHVKRRLLRTRSSSVGGASVSSTVISSWNTACASWDVSHAAALLPPTPCGRGRLSRSPRVSSYLSNHAAIARSRSLGRPRRAAAERAIHLPVSLRTLANAPANAVSTRLTFTPLTLPESQRFANGIYYFLRLFGPRTPTHGALMVMACMSTGETKTSRSLPSWAMATALTHQPPASGARCAEVEVRTVTLPGQGPRRLGGRP